VGTRHDPPLRLARLAARRQLAELRRPDLGFSQAEAHQLLNETLGLSLAPAEVAALQERTEGWPGALCLLAGPLGRMGTADDRSQFMTAVIRMERYALDFLAEEVLRNLDADLRRFLMQTAILTEMTPSACRAVTGREDAADVLEGLYRQNLTIASIAADSEGEPVYRHHTLFARLLSRQLERELPGEITELHRRAARVALTPGRAIAHYMAAGLWEDAAQLMAQSGMDLFHRGMSETVRSWGRSLPAEVRARHPGLTVLMGRCEIHRGDYAAAGIFLNEAREAFVAGGDLGGEGDALTSLLTLAYRNDDRAAAATYVERALQLPLSPMGQAAARLVRAWLHLYDCDWDAIRTDMQAAFALAHATGDPRIDMVGVPYMSAALAAVPGCLELAERYATDAAGRTLADTAWRMGADELAIWPLLWRGQAHEALARAEATEALRQRLGGYPFMGVELPVQLAILYAARGDLDGAAHAAETLLQRMPGSGPSKWAFYLHAAGWALALAGRHADAAALLERLQSMADEQPLTAYLRHHLAGLLALLEGRRQECAAALERGARMEAELPIAWVGGSARLLQARLLLEQGKADAAFAAATPVLTRWEQAGTPGCALLDGPAGLPVLRLAAQRGHEAAVRLLRLFPAAAPAGKSAAPATAATLNLPEPLTQREQDVLKLIVAGRTNRQIGEELYITEETVKTHVVRILRKLDVASRTQAAIRGRELGF
jgi:LuxR family maltose regulon positive regulatory protein